MRDCADRRATCRTTLWLLAAGAGVVLLTLLAASGCGKGKPGGSPGAEAEAQGSGPTPVSVVTATRQTIREELALTGTCKAFDEVDVVSEMAGKMIKVTKDVGDRVQAGELLAKLDTSLAAQQTLSARKGVDSAQARLHQAVKGAELTDRETVINIRQAEQGVAATQQTLRKAEESYRLTREQTESRIEQARVAVASAQAQQRDVAAGSRTQEIAQAEAAVRTAESSLSLRKTDYDRYSKLYYNGAVAEATLDGYRTQYEVAQQSLAQAREALSLIREGARQEQKRMAGLGVDQAREQLRQAESARRQVQMAARDVESARVGVRQAQENLRLAVASRRRYDVSIADVRVAKAGVGQAAAGRSLAETTEGKYTIYAPISGTIASRAVDVGEGIKVGDTVMRVVDSDPIRLDAEVSELDIDRVKFGDEGTTRVDGLPGRDFAGRVTGITPQAIEGQRNYIVRVEVANTEGTIKSGMFARVSLGISEKPDVVVAPRDCLVERGPDRFAYVVAGDAVKVRKVKLGVVSGEFVEIVSGVSAGDQLVVSGQSMLAEGQKVKAVPQEASPKAEATASAGKGAGTAPQPAQAEAPEPSAPRSGPAPGKGPRPAR